MSYELVNVPSKDSYTELLCPNAVRLNIQVFNAAVLWAPGRGFAPVYGQDSYLAPNGGSFDRLADAVRFKSAVPGTPAQVSISALGESEVPGG